VSNLEGQHYQPLQKLPDEIVESGQRSGAWLQMRVKQRRPWTRIGVNASEARTLCESENPATLVDCE
jgi:hypothetical protein